MFAEYNMAIKERFSGYFGFSDGELAMIKSPRNIAAKLRFFGRIQKKQAIAMWTKQNL